MSCLNNGNIWVDARKEPAWVNVFFFILFFTPSGVKYNSRLAVPLLQIVGDTTGPGVFQISFGYEKSKKVGTTV